MADDWEDWEADDYVPKLPAAAPANGTEVVTKGAQLLSDDPDPSKFAGEDEEEDRPSWEGNVPRPQQKKAVVKKYDESRGVTNDTPLDDPVLEKLRRQRLEEEGDYAATKELFGEGGLDLDGMLPKSANDFEKYAEGIYFKYMYPHRDSPHYKQLLKQLLKRALKPLGVQETKDIETAVAGVRAVKVKEEVTAKAEAKKGGKKKTLNVGKSGGSAGLEDYHMPALDDDYDFM